jgi:arylsulfatase A-like enzyme
MSVKLNHFFYCFLIILIILSCKSDEDDLCCPPDDNANPNILLIIADDMGLDASPGYNIGTLKPNMPNLQSLINSGVRFNNVWSNPLCSPTRSTILTGKYGYRTGVLNVDEPLSTSEISLQTYITNNSGNEYSNAVIGKWHLSGTPTQPLHPNNMGIQYFSGVIGGGVQSYYSWNHTENGNTNTSNEYTTTRFTDDAITWINDQSQPWFLWLAYNAPHTPFHLPPSDLHYQGSLPEDQASIDANPLPYYLAAIEAIDTEMGRLFNSISSEDLENTVIIFLGDNGTPGQVAQQYHSLRAKGTLYKGGINVPMIISGKDVSRINAQENALISTTDIFATISELCGISTDEIHDSISFQDLLNSGGSNNRSHIYSELGSNYFAVRNLTHKYMSFEDGSEALYNLEENSFEMPNLLNPIQLPLSDNNQQNQSQLIAIANQIRN